MNEFITAITAIGGTLGTVFFKEWYSNRNGKGIHAKVDALNTHFNEETSARLKGIEDKQETESRTTFEHRTREEIWQKEMLEAIRNKQ